ncbi:olfactory receptor 52E4-like [Amia ocellicauda]|uniref:olfactory receptor 52E4-like n=1 Tax=Amia ocellicauda TaxID=2972642 RepID=UPI003464C867
MENSSQIASFTMAAYGEIGGVRYLYFMIVLLSYLVIIIANVFLIVVIYMERSLHEPMYYFLCSLAINALYGSSGLFPSVLQNLLSDIHEISWTHCLLQTFCLHTYVFSEFTNLAVMGYDRYVSICYPLQYHKIMSPSRVNKLIVLTWVVPFCCFTAIMVMTTQQQICGKIIEKVYCTNYAILSLACRDITTFNIIGGVSVIIYIFPLVVLIFYSYSRILRICFKSSKEATAKALNTCCSHLITLVNFSLGCFFEVIQSRFNLSHIPSSIQIILSVYFLTCPPLLNPIIYGVRSKTIRMRIKKMVYHRIRDVRHFENTFK